MSLRVGIVGVTGYAGGELVRLIYGHPKLSLNLVCARSAVGKPLSKVIPTMAGLDLPDVTPIDDVALAAQDLVFMALPHGVSAELADRILSRHTGTVVVDLSADFRLTHQAVFEKWYGAHGAPARFGSAAYGLVELNRQAIGDASLIAVAGCYPTASVLAAAPLVQSGLLTSSHLIIDAKSGVAGAGRTPSSATHLPESAEGIRAYKAGGRHRHIPEIEQSLSSLHTERVHVTFTPHLVPMTRGILSTVYAQVEEGASAERVTGLASSMYRESSSVVVHPVGTHPDTLWVRGSNRAHVSYVLDERTNTLIGQCVIDNLVKGAAGQAVQCANVRMGFPEGMGLPELGAWP